MTSTISGRFYSATLPPRLFRPDLYFIVKYLIKWHTGKYAENMMEISFENSNIFSGEYNQKVIFEIAVINNIFLSSNLSKKKKQWTHEKITQTVGWFLSITTANQISNFKIVIYTSRITRRYGRRCVIVDPRRSRGR